MRAAAATGADEECPGFKPGELRTPAGNRLERWGYDIPGRGGCQRSEPEGQGGQKELGFGATPGPEA
jgi:hypothetical protein